MPDAWKQGLKDAGIAVEATKVYRNGHWETLPLVVQFPCPFDHTNESGEGWAKVRLKVNPFSGWVSIHADSCRHCTRQQIEDWLLACPRCVAGEDLTEHPDHEAAFYVPDGDESPIAYVAEAMAQFQHGGALVADSPKAPTTVEATVEWLAALMTEDGSLMVPPTMGQNPAWAVVKHLPGCPTQELVRQAQAKRKADGTG